MEVSQLEYKSTPLQLKDISPEKRTVVFAHATYDNIDRTGDVARAGMFDKTWSEHKADIKFYENHEPTQPLGKVLDVWEEKADGQAMTHGKLANTTRGNDMLEMLDMEIVTGASFGFKAIKAPTITVKGKKVRELREVYHGESTLANGLTPVNPLSSVKMVYKAMNTLTGLDLKALNDQEQAFLTRVISSGIASVKMALDLADSMDPQSDLYSWVMYFVQTNASWIGDARNNLRWGTKAMEASMLDMKAHAANMERFVRNAKASDDCIQNIEAELKAANHIISLYDTVTTHEIDEPGISGKSNGNDEDLVLTKLHLLNAKMSIHERGFRSGVRS